MSKVTALLELTATYSITSDETVHKLQDMGFAVRMPPTALVA